MKKSVLLVFLFLLFLPLWAASSTPLQETKTTRTNTSILLPNCEDLSIDIGMTQLSPCNSPYLQVFYCNNDVATATDVVLEIDIDEIFTILFSEVPGTITGNHLQIPIGDLIAGDCGQFEISTRLSCDILLYKTYINEATILSSNCVADDMPAIIALESNIDCDGATTTFSLHNKSNETWEDLSAIIVQDDVILFQIEDDTFDIIQESIIVQDDVILLHGGFNHIPAQDSLVFSINLADVSFIQLDVKNTTARLDFPDFLEGCDNTEGSGFPPQYLTSDATPHQVKEYRTLDLLTPNAEIFDSKFLTLPTGFSPRHYVLPNTPIEYSLYYFEEVSQQGGNEVVVTIVLPSFLDETSIVPGASVRSYVFNQSGNSLSFTIDNPIILEINGRFYMDGFVKFKVQQQADLPVGTEINNSGSIAINGTTIETVNYFHTVAAETASLYPKDNIRISANMPEQLPICGEADTVTVTVVNQNTVAMGSIEVHTFFPNNERGIQMTGLVPHSDVLWINPPNYSDPYASSVNPIFITNKLLPNDSLSFSFLIAGDCELIPYAEDNPIALYFELFWNNKFAFYADHLSTDNEENENINLEVPNLVLNFDNQNYDGEVGETFTRTISITNTASPYLVDDLFVLHKLEDDYVLNSVSAGILSATDTLGIMGYEDYIAYRIDTVTVARFGDGDAYLEQGETLEIIETIQITGCEQLNSKYEMLWACAAEFDITAFCGQDIFEANIMTVEMPENGTGDCITTSTNEIMDEVLQVYPNPSTGKIDIILPFSNSIINISVYDTFGRKIHQIPSHAMTNKTLLQLDLNDVMKGVYLLKIELEESYFSKKIILK